MPVRLRTRRLVLELETPTSVLARIESMDPESQAQVSASWLASVRALTAPDPWVCGFSAVLADTGVAIGSCGFKGPPLAEGEVEIAYGVQPSHEGHGFATEMATALTRFAFEDPRVRIVRAHTLRDGHASQRVLSKCSFLRVGDVVDPEDGVVVRFERRRATTD